MLARAPKVAPLPNARAEHSTRHTKKSEEQDDPKEEQGGDCGSSGTHVGRRNDLSRTFACQGLGDGDRTQRYRRVIRDGFPGCQGAICEGGFATICRGVAAGSPPASRSCALLGPLWGAFGDLDPVRRLLVGIPAG
jgi:hypothetical protein